jgi:hypothetical protein
LLTGPDHVRKFYGANLAEVFRTPLYDCSLKNVSGVPDFALTRLKGGSMEMQRAPAYPEDRAMLICVALAPTPVDRWLGYCLGALMVFMTAVRNDGIDAAVWYHGSRHRSVTRIWQSSGKQRSEQQLPPN